MQRCVLFLSPRRPLASTHALPFLRPLSLAPLLPAHNPQNFADERGFQFFETSAKNSNNVEKVFLTMTAEIKNRMAKAPQQQDDAGKVRVGDGEKVGAKAGGGCC